MIFSKGTSIYKYELIQKLGSGNCSYEELQQLSSTIGEVTQQLDEKELRWLELSERS